MENNNQFALIFKKQQDYRLIARNSNASERIRKLSRLEKEILNNRQAFKEAIFSDFQKPGTETDLTELYVVLHEIRFVKARLRNWMRSIKIETPLALSGSRSSVLHEGKGTCLIISPWNYPVNLTLGPLVSALAAGNTVILKPSELTPKTSALLKIMLSGIFTEEEIFVAEGGKETAEELLSFPFDHIFFTGSERTGIKVLKAAAENLISVTLELGGKSPAYVHIDANIEDAAEKIAAAKFINAGQTCIAPDYVICHEAVYENLLKHLQHNSLKYQNGSSIINRFHFDRIHQLMDEKVSNLHDEKNKIKPKIIPVVNLKSSIMKEEIFGPVLPILKVSNVDEALKIMNDLEPSLSIYIFTKSKNIKNFFITNTSSGSICFNECAVQFLNPALPFGGIRQSGMGRSHGKSGFLTFSNERSVFRQRIGFTTAKLLYPPYSRLQLKIITLLLKYF